MSELDRILTRSFRAGRAETPDSDEGKARTLAALGLLVPREAGARPPATSDAVANAARHGWRRWSIVVAVAVVVASGGAWKFFAEGGEPVHVASLAPTVTDAPASTEARPAPSATVPIGAAALAVNDLPSAPAGVVGAAHAGKPSEPSALGSAAPASSAMRTAPLAHSARPPTASPPAADAPVSEKRASLREEVEALGRASRALSERRCGDARAALAAYRASFPSGRLEREADVVDIEITGRFGDRDSAKRAARRFVARFPDSPYAIRLSPWLRDDGDATSVARCVDAIP